MCLAWTNAPAAPGPAPNPMSGKSVAALEKVIESEAPEMDRAHAAMERFLNDRKPKPGQKQDMSSLKEGLVDYFRFDDLTTVSSINGTKGELVSNETFGEPVQIEGKFGKSIKLNGKQGIVFPGYKDPVNGKGMIELLSVSFWARNFSGNGIYRLGKGKGKPFAAASGPGTLDTWFLSSRANELGWDLRGFSRGNFGITSSVLKEGLRRTSGAFTPTGMSGNGVEWVHMVVVYDG